MSSTMVRWPDFEFVFGIIQILESSVGCFPAAVMVESTTRIESQLDIGTEFKRTRFNYREPLPIYSVLNSRFTI